MASSIGFCSSNSSALQHDEKRRVLFARVSGEPGDKIDHAPGRVGALFANLGIDIDAVEHHAVEAKLDQAI